MVFMADWKLRTKLLAGFVVVALLSALVGLIGIRSLKHIDQTETVLYEEGVDSLDDVGKIENDIRDIRIDTMEAVISEDTKAAQTHLAEAEEKEKELAKDLKGYEKTLNSDKDHRNFEELNAKLSTFLEKISEVDKDIEAGNAKAAMRELLGDAMKASNAVTIRAEEIVNEQLAFANQIHTDNEAASADAETQMIVTIGVCLGLALLLGFFLSSSITKQVTEVTTGLNEGASQVAAVSGQVSQASQQLAEGAAESASSLEETSSSLEEMGSMTRQNADNAAQASRLMEETKASMTKGNDSVMETVRAMKRINESADKVSRIVKTIEEIAFQTNLLALNAAVEAARAGEHGRGFAVVAEEVRNLAQRSAVAAKDTAQLIEENAHQAGNGAKISEEAGKALAETVERSRKVADLLGEIAAASQEQSKGIQEISAAMTQLDKVTQSNTANAEESASASEEMAGQAESLKNLVSQLVRVVEGSSARSMEVLRSAAENRAVKTATTTFSAPVAGSYKAKASGNGSKHINEKIHKLVESATHRSPEQVIPLTKEEMKGF
jgi:methyl-accepting chemotaxis protein